MHIKLRVTDIFCVPCWTYISFNGIRTSRIKRDIIFTMRGRKSEESRSVYVCVCGIFEFFKFCTLSLSPLSVATSVFNFLWITLSSQLSTPGITCTRVCYSSRERVRVLYFRRAFTHCSFAS